MSKRSPTVLCFVFLLIRLGSEEYTFTFPVVIYFLVALFELNCHCMFSCEFVGGVLCGLVMAVVAILWVGRWVVGGWVIFVVGQFIAWVCCTSWNQSNSGVI